MILRLGEFPLQTPCSLLHRLVVVTELCARPLRARLSAFLSVSQRDRGRGMLLRAPWSPDAALSPAHWAHAQAGGGKRGGQASPHRGAGGTLAQPRPLNPRLSLTGPSISLHWQGNGDLRNAVALPRPQVREQGDEGVAKRTSRWAMRTTLNQQVSSSD